MKRGKSNKGCLPLIAAIVFISIGIVLCSKDIPPAPLVSASAYDGSVRQVVTYLEDHLKDPDSYQPIEWSPLIDNGNTLHKYTIRHKYRAKNSFGGYVIENQVFQLDSLGNITKVLSLED